MEMVLLLARLSLLVAGAAAVSEPAAEPHFLSNGSWAHPDIDPSYFSGRAPVPGPQYQYPANVQYQPANVQYQPSNVQYLPARPGAQVLDRRAGQTLSYDNGMYGTLLPHTQHAAMPGQQYTASGFPITYPVTQSGQGFGQYPVQLAAQYPTGQAQYPVTQAAQYPVSQAAQYPVSQAAQYPVSQAAQYPVSQGIQYLTNPTGSYGNGLYAAQTYPGPARPQYPYQTGFASMPTYGAGQAAGARLVPTITNLCTNRLGARVPCYA